MLITLSNGLAVLPLSAVSSAPFRMPSIIFSIDASSVYAGGMIWFTGNLR